MIEFIDPEDIEQRMDIILDMQEFGIDHFNLPSRLGWNYVLDHTWLSQKFNKFINIKGKNLVILDVGCGASPFHNYLESKYDVDILGIDRPTGYCNQAVLRNVDYFVYFLQFDALEENSVDLIFWLSAIEHNEIDIIKRLYLKSMELLKRNGLLLITFPISEKTHWFKPSQQTNLSIADSKAIFDEQEVKGDFGQIKTKYQRNILRLNEKYRQRYHNVFTRWINFNDPQFIVAGLSKTVS